MQLTCFLEYALHTCKHRTSQQGEVRVVEERNTVASGVPGVWMEKERQ